MRRLFFGLEVPAGIRQRLLQVQAPLSGARWQRDEQLHITLLFLGDVEPGRVPGVCEAARSVPNEPFAIDVLGLDCFGQPHNPHHLWAGVQPLNPVAALHATLVTRMTDLGFIPDNRAFCPHVTLARFGKQPGSVKTLLADYRGVSFGASGVSEFVLFESQRGENGSTYTVIDRFALCVRSGCV